jgi:hypothetical protein
VCISDSLSLDLSHYFCQEFHPSQIFMAYVLLMQYINCYEVNRNYDGQLKCGYCL